MDFFAFRKQQHIVLYTLFVSVFSVICALYNTWATLVIMGFPICPYYTVRAYDRHTYVGSRGTNYGNQKFSRTFLDLHNRTVCWTFTGNRKQAYPGLERKVVFPSKRKSCYTKERASAPWLPEIVLTLSEATSLKAFYAGGFESFLG